MNTSLKSRKVATLFDDSPPSEKSWRKSRRKKTFTFIDLFAGIGGIRIPLEKAGGECVFGSEWDENSQKTYSVNFGEIPAGDITKIDEKEIPDHQVLCAGFPCQAFSVSGKRHGFEDARGTLFFDIARIAKRKKPDVLFLENVKNFARHDGGRTIETVRDVLDSIEYDLFVGLLKASDFGVPQARERVYMIAFRKDLGVRDFEFPKGNARHKVVKDVLEKEDDVNARVIDRDDMKIYGDPNAVVNPRRPLQIGTINKGGQGERIYSVNAAGITLSAYGGGVASKTGAYLVNGKIRKLTPRECARLQGFPEDFEIPVSAGAAYKQFGNSVSIPVIEAIFKEVKSVYPALKGQERGAEKNA